MAAGSSSGRDLLLSFLFVPLLSADNHGPTNTSSSMLMGGGVLRFATSFFPLHFSVFIALALLQETLNIRYIDSVFCVYKSHDVVTLHVGVDGNISIAEMKIITAGVHVSDEPMILSQGTLKN